MPGRFCVLCIVSPHLAKLTADSPKGGKSDGKSHNQGLQALEDQLGLEKLLYCKYQDAAQQSSDQALQAQFGAMPSSTRPTTAIF